MVIEVQRSPDVSAEDMPTTRASHDTLDSRGDRSEWKGNSDALTRQHKRAKQWTHSCSMEYPASTEDGGVMAVCRPGQGGINRGNAGAIVGSILQKASEFRNGPYIGGVERGLEHKIQELRSERETEVTIQCSSSIHSDQDSPIDFSVKRRSSFSGSLTDDSQASMRSAGNGTDYNDMSPGIDSGCVSHTADVSKRSTPSPHKFDDKKLIGQQEFDDKKLIGQQEFDDKKFIDQQEFDDKKLIGQQEFDLSPAAKSSPFLSIGAFSGLPQNLMNNGSALGAFSQMTSAFPDPRSRKSSRPFKAYPKDPLQMPLGFLGIPGMTSGSVQKGVESGIFAGMNSEDIVSMYNQQLQLLRDKQLSGPERSTSPPFQTSTSSRDHLSPLHREHHSNSPYSGLSMSPPLLTPDHTQSNRGPSTNFPGSNGPATGPHVSSTSSFGHSNSRKRPRSLPDEQKDAAYWERRRKNNDAAKRSRDARRAKEDEIAIRAALLEQENLKLRVEVAALKTETARLRCLLYN